MGIERQHGLFLTNVSGTNTFSWALGAAAAFWGTVLLTRRLTVSIWRLNTNTTFSGNIQNSSGIVALTKTGTGVLTLAGNNDNYSGGTSVTGGLSTCGNPSQQLPSGTVTIGAQGTINFVPASEAYRTERPELLYRGGWRQWPGCNLGDLQRHRQRR